MTRPDQTVSQASDSIAEFLSTYFANNFYISPSQSNEMVLESLKLDRERTPPLADELRSELASRIFVRATNAATSLIKEKIGSDNDVEAPLFLQVLLLMTDEEEADIESFMFSELKHKIDFYSALDALRKYHLNFSIFFIEEIQKELKELTLQGQNIFEIDPNQFLVDSLNLRPLADKKIKEVLEKLGIKDEDFSILNLLDSKKDEKTGAAIYSWKPKEEIAQFFVNKFMAKYPALKRYQPEQERLESFCRNSLTSNYLVNNYIMNLLKSEDIDQNFIGLQLLYARAQNDSASIHKVFCHMFLLQSKTFQTVEDFIDQPNQLLKDLKQKFSQQKIAQDACEYLGKSLEINYKLILKWAYFCAVMEKNKKFIKDIEDNYAFAKPDLPLILFFAIYYTPRILITDFLKQLTPEQKNQIADFRIDEKTILEYIFEIDDKELIKAILNGFDNDEIAGNFLDKMWKEACYSFNPKNIKLVLDVCDDEKKMEFITCGEDLLSIALGSKDRSDGVELLKIIFNVYGCDYEYILEMLKRVIAFDRPEFLEAVPDGLSQEDKMKIFSSDTIVGHSLRYIFVSSVKEWIMDFVVDNFVVNDRNREIFFERLVLNGGSLKNLIDQEKFKAIGFLYKVGVKIPDLEKNEECRRSVIQTMIGDLAGLKEVADQEFCLGKIFKLATKQDLEVETIQQSLNTYANSGSTAEDLKQRVNDKINKPLTNLVRRDLDGIQSRRSRVVDSTHNPAISSPR